MFQPKIVGALAIVGVCFQNARVFLALSALLWWSALAPERNVFDAIYNVVAAAPRGLSRLRPAPAPRRFAMGMAGTITLVIGSALLRAMFTTAWIFEGIFIAAIASVILEVSVGGRTCSTFSVWDHHNVTSPLDDQSRHDGRRPSCARSSR